MNWKQWLTFDPYKKLYSLIGGRPFTYIIRDTWNEAEWLMQTIWFWLGIAVGIHFSWKIALVIWTIYTFGYINGHLFWGTRWIKHQKGD